ncbi:MAG TPA: hypothetical protein VHI52_07295, partial [Verrucomicrobiae bacterium]|nr:hypothetical protein [Verrucomicrobiae bacterium]
MPQRFRSILDRRLHGFVSVVALAPGFFLSPVSGQAAVTLSALRCEYRTNPMGLDIVHPRLSWILSSEERGEKQTAYQILVASSAER